MQVGFVQRLVLPTDKRAHFSLIIPTAVTEVYNEKDIVENISWRHLCNNFITAYFNNVLQCSMSPTRFCCPDYNYDAVIQRVFEDMTKQIQQEHKKGENKVTFCFDLSQMMVNVMKPEQK